MRLSRSTLKGLSPRIFMTRVLSKLRVRVTRFRRARLRFKSEGGRIRQLIVACSVVWEQETDMQRWCAFTPIHTSSGSYFIAALVEQPLWLRGLDMSATGRKQPSKSLTSMAMTPLLPIQRSSSSLIPATTLSHFSASQTNY